MNGCIDSITLSRLQDGMLSEEESSRVQDHLSRCADCRQLARAKVVSDRALAAAAVPGEAQADGCPELTVLASYAEGRLAETSRDRVTRHLADCDACLGSLAALGRELATITELPLESVPELALEQARAMVGTPIAATTGSAQPAHEASDSWLGRGWQWLEGLRLAPGFGLAAVAAAVLVAVLMVPPLGENGLPPAVERGVVTEPLVELKTPTNDQLIAVDDMMLTWSPLRRASSYTVTVVDASGAFFRQYTVADTRLELPAEDGWVPGVRYTWWVAALLEDGTHQGSDHRSFRLQGATTP